MRSLIAFFFLIDRGDGIADRTVASLWNYAGQFQLVQPQLGKISGLASGKKQKLRREIAVPDTEERKAADVLKTAIGPNIAGILSGKIHEAVVDDKDHEDEDYDETDNETATNRSVATNTEEPTPAPTPKPTEMPTQEPSEAPVVPASTADPIQTPTLVPTLVPSLEPTSTPTPKPTYTPTLVPTLEPTRAPTTPMPTMEPTRTPTSVPTPAPTPAVDTWLEYTGKTLNAGRPHVITDMNTLSGCKESCVDDPFCKGVDYYTDTGLCLGWSDGQGASPKDQVEVDAYFLRRLETVWTEHLGTALTGSKAYLVSTEDSATACKKRCEEDVKCYGVNYDTVAGLCNGFDSFLLIPTNVSSVDAYLLYRATSVWDKYTNQSLHAGTSFSLGGIRSVEQCKRICINNPECQGFDYYKADEACRGWDSFYAQPSRKPDVDAYLLRRPLAFLSEHLWEEFPHQTLNAGTAIPITTLPEESVEGCKQACIHEEKCQGVDYDRNKRKCTGWLGTVAYPMDNVHVYGYSLHRPSSHATHIISGAGHKRTSTTLTSTNASNRTTFAPTPLPPTTTPTHVPTLSPPAHAPTLSPTIAITQAPSTEALSMTLVPTDAPTAAPATTPTALDGTPSPVFPNSSLNSSSLTSNSTTPPPPKTAS